MTYSLSTWKLIVAGISSLILTMGIARFALTPLLPAMQEATGLGNDGAGFLAAANYAGYLSGALIASRLRNPAVKLACYRWGLLFAILTTLVMAIGDNLILWVAFRYIAGLTSAAGMVICTALVLDHLNKRHRPDLIGVHFSGVGLGVILSGSVLSYIAPFTTWDEGWLVIGLFALVLAVPAFFWINTDGLETAPHKPDGAVKLHQRQIVMLLISYCFAGATFSIGSTFIITIMAENPALADSRNLAWVLLGVALAPSCYAWMKIAGRIGDFKSLSYAYLIQAIGCALPVLWPSPMTALLGGFLFGSCFMGIVTIVLSLGGKLSPHNPSALIGILVVSYGVGQIVGPVLAGIAMEQTGISALGLWSAAACSLISIVFLLGTRCSKGSPNPEGRACLS